MHTIAAAKKAGWETEKKTRTDPSLLCLGVQCVWQQEPDHFTVVAVKEKNSSTLPRIDAMATAIRNGDSYSKRSASRNQAVATSAQSATP